MVEDENGRLIIRLGDTTDHGGEVITGADTWTVEGRPVARIGDKVRCPKCDNKIYEIVEGNPKITVFGRPAAFEGHQTSCGAKLISSLSHGGRVRQTTVNLSNQSNFNGVIATNNPYLPSPIKPQNRRTEDEKIEDGNKRPSDLLKEDEQAIFARYREAVNFMNSHGIRFKGALMEYKSYALIDSSWNNLMSKDGFTYFGLGDYLRCQPQAHLIIDWIYDLDLHYEWKINLAAKQNPITGNDMHYWVEVIPPIGHRLIVLDSWKDKSNFSERATEYHSSTNINYLYYPEYNEYRFESSQKLRPRKIIN